MPRMPRRSARTRALQQQVRRDAARFEHFFESTAAEFDDAMRVVSFTTCPGCLRRNIDDQLNRPPRTCRACRANANHSLTPSNNLDFGAIPDELQGLSLIEQVLIARIHPVVSVYKIRGQQRGYSGHVMNFVQHIDTMITRLPPLVSSISSIILLNKTTADGVAQFRARADRVRKALEWLQRNNQYYSNIQIDHDAIASLPVDGNVAAQLPCISQEQEPPLDDPEADGDNLINASCFPSIPNVDAQDVINSTIRRVDGSQSTQDIGEWPEMGMTPVDEANSEGYVCKAFPVLFPYGRSDLLEPRLTRIPKHAYFKYLMQYHDGRFANDLRFPYFAYNTLARWDAMNCGSVYVRMNNMEGFSAEDILQMANDPCQDVASSIMYYGASIRGTRSYWKQRSAELLQMTRQLGLPTIFFTLSAADYHWPDLFRLLCPNQPIEDLREQQRRDIMHDNPATVAWFFNHRCDVFLKKFISKFFPVEDYWYKFEWQHRGSPHIHGVSWFNESPDCSEIDSLTESERAVISEYFDELISATISEVAPGRLLPSTNPCRVRFSDIPRESRALDLEKLLSYAQRHTRCGRHCLRKKRGTRVEQCRFGFPLPLEEHSVIRRDAGAWKFFPRRNDSLLQRHNKYIAQVWRGNTDFSAITSKDAFISYIAKYASKGEYASENYSTILHRVINRNENDAPAARLIRQLLISSVAERNFSAQEVMHLLFGWPLFHASRSMSVLSLLEWRRFEGTGRSTNSPVTNYANRAEELEGITLFAYAKKYYKRGDRTITRNKECVLRIIPYLRLTDDDFDQNEEYYKQQCKLHIPWREPFVDILPSGSSWYELYNARVREDRDEPFLDQLPNNPEEVEFEPDNFEMANIVRDANLAAARIEPLHAGQQRDPLGYRLIDEAHDWSTYNEQVGFTSEHVIQYLRSYQSFPPTTISRQPTIDLDRLSVKQREIYDPVVDQAHNATSIKRVIVQGKAGTGKSAIIKIIAKYLSDDDPRKFEILAPTGAAAVNVDGKTIHSFFRIPVFGPVLSMNGETLRTFQLRMADLQFLIFDEYSMIGLRLLQKIHLRLCQGKGVNAPFGGLNIYLFGDLRQLPPVKDIALYSEPSDDFSRLSLSLVDSIQKYIVLDVVHRQSEIQRQFKRVLDNVGTTRVTQDDWTFLMTRRASINPPGYQTFRNAIHLYPKNSLVNEHNTARLASLRLPIAIIDAEHNNSTARQASDMTAGGLSSRLLLSIGCRVMLRKNLCVDRGLVNGALGTVLDIIWQLHQRPPALPHCILVGFEKFTGPYLADTIKDHQGFPILVTTAAWRCDAVTRHTRGH